YNKKLPVDGASKAICDLFEIDHRYCVGAGSMIMAVQKGIENKLIHHLQKQNIPAAVVGEFTNPQEGLQIIENSQPRKLFFNGEDPYWKAFFEATKAGWK